MENNVVKCRVPLLLESISLILCSLPYYCEIHRRVSSTSHPAFPNLRLSRSFVPRRLCSRSIRRIWSVLPSLVWSECFTVHRQVERPLADCPKSMFATLYSSSAGGRKSLSTRDAQALFKPCHHVMITVNSGDRRGLTISDGSLTLPCPSLDDIQKFAVKGGIGHKYPNA